MAEPIDLIRDYWSSRRLDFPADEEGDDAFLAAVGASSMAVMDIELDPETAAICEEELSGMLDATGLLRGEVAAHLDTLRAMHYPTT